MALTWPDYAHLAGGETRRWAPDVTRTRFDDGAVQQRRVYTAGIVRREVVAQIPGARATEFDVWLHGTAGGDFSADDPLDGATRQFRLVDGAGGARWRQVAGAGARPWWEVRMQLEAVHTPAFPAGATAVWPAWAHLDADESRQRTIEVSRTQFDGGAVVQRRTRPSAGMARDVVAQIPGDRAAEFEAWLYAFCHANFTMRYPGDGNYYKARVVGGISGTEWRQVARRGGQRYWWEVRFQVEAAFGAVALGGFSGAAPPGVVPPSQRFPVIVCADTLTVIRGFRVRWPLRVDPAPGIEELPALTIGDGVRGLDWSRTEQALLGVVANDAVTGARTMRLSARTSSSGTATRDVALTVLADLPVMFGALQTELTGWSAGYPDSVHLQGNI